MQTRKQSLIEAVVNIGTGMVIAFSISQLASYIPGFNWNVGFEANIVMTVVLTLISVLRSYLWRRFFNGRHSNERNK